MTAFAKFLLCATAATLVFVTAVRAQDDERKDAEGCKPIADNSAEDGRAKNRRVERVKQ